MLWLFYLPSSFVVLLLFWLIPKYMRIRRIDRYFKEIPGPRIMGMFSDLTPILRQNLDLQDPWGFREIYLYYTFQISEILRVSLETFILSKRFFNFLPENWFLKYLHEVPVGIKSFLVAYPRLFQEEGIISIWAFLVPGILLYKPETIEVIMNHHSSLDKPEEYDLLHPWLGNGLITSQGSLWKKHRKILTPAFHLRILEEFVPIINEQSKVLVDHFQNHSNEPWIDMLPYVTSCALDVICETSMGIKLGAQYGKELEYTKALISIQENMLVRALVPWLRPNVIYYALPQGREFLKQLNVVRKFTEQMVKNRKSNMLSQGWEYDEQSLKQDGNSLKPKRRLAFLDLLLQYHINDKQLTEEEVQDEVNTFMFAGHHTTSLGISWTLYLLGLHPEVQEKVYQELDEIFGQNKDRPVEIEDMKKLKYIECVIKESQRLYPPVPLIGRRTYEDLNIDGYTVPGGVTCLILLRELHRNPKFFPEPDRFVPERFFPENSKGRHPYAFVPFSVGPRKCIGQRFAMNEEKIVLSTVLRHFRVVSLDHQDKLRLDISVVLKPKDPLRMKFIPR